ncbi:MAG: C4-dicarboxylate ABC transporter substrate-binding protein [Syntrophus sp. (in: bacteria)]|nr:C4-dicarboxylate ABC transporter substrate-binding protein [Syntrophus sp. (in: bacteria)]
MSTMKGTKKLIGLVMMVSLFLFCGLVIAEAAEKQILLKVSTFFSPQDEIAITLGNWCKEVEKRTNGRIKTRFFPGATLASPPQQYDAVVKGIADVSQHVLGYTMGRFPLSEVMDLPLGIPNGVAASKMMNEYFKKFNPKEFDEIKVLWMHGQGPGYVCTRNKPVNKMADLKGMRLRTYGGNAKFLTALGGAPVAMPMTEVYDALSRGMVDGLLSGIGPLYGFRTGEHIKYVTLNKLTSYTAAQAVIMNKKVWSSLSPDIQKILDDLSAEYIEKFGQAWDKQDEVALAKFKSTLTFIPLPKDEDQRWADMGAKPLYDDYVKRMKEKGLPGDQSLAFIQNYLKQYR